MYKDQNGSHIVAILLIVVVLGVVGFAGYTVMKKNDKKRASTSQTPAGETSAKAVKITIKEEGKLALPNGYADPTLAKTATGYRMYVNRQSGGPSGYGTFVSTDGVTWTQEKAQVIAGAATGRAVVFPDGIRLYYPGQQPIKPTDPQANMLSSFTTDGTTFTKDAGDRIESKGGYYVEGPTVFQLADKSWQMYFNENSVAAGMQRDGIIWGATSADGLAWTRDAKPTIESDDVEAVLKQPWKQVLHPFVVKNPKGGYIMFYNSHSQVFAATSKDGKTWEKIGQVGIDGADVDGYFQEDGTFRIFYGNFSEATGGVVYSGVLTIE